MPFPNPQILNAFVDTYISRRQPDWNSFAETIKWFLNIAPWSTYQGASAKKNICDKLKNDFITPPASGSKEIEKWAKICINLGDIATTTMKLNKASMIAKYLHATRTYILNTLTSSEDTRKELDDYICQLKSKISSKGNVTDAKTPEPSKEVVERQLLDLVYLGNVSCIIEARKLNLLAMYDVADPSKADCIPFCLENNYYSTKFFNEEIRPNSSHATFENFENSITAPKATATPEVKPETAAKEPIVEEAKECKQASVVTPSTTPVAEEKFSIILTTEPASIAPPKPASLNKAEVKVAEPVIEKSNTTEEKKESKSDSRYLPPINVPRYLNPVNPSKKIYSNFGLFIDTKTNDEKHDNEIDHPAEISEEIKPVARDKKHQRVAAIRGRQTVFKEKTPVKVVEPVKTADDDSYNARNARRRKRFS